MVESEMVDPDPFLTFAKTSRVVHRQGLENGLDRPQLQPTCLQESRENIWNRVLNQSDDEDSTELDSPFQVQWFSNKPGAQVGVPSVEMSPAALRGRGRKQLRARALPSPAELMGQRKRGRAGSTGSRGLQPRVSAVLQHISDLSRRQGSVDQLKRERWWGRAGQEGSVEVPEDSSMSGAEAPQEPGLTYSSNDAELVKEAAVSVIPTLTRPERLFGGFEEAPHLAPGGNPMMSFVLATADRQATGQWQSSRLSPEEFWGFVHAEEE